MNTQAHMQACTGQVAWILLSGGGNNLQKTQTETLLVLIPSEYFAVERAPSK